MDPYRVLGLERGASTEQIRTAYRTLVAQYHPDKVATMAAEIRSLAMERTKQINAAYAALLRSRAD